MKNIYIVTIILFSFSTRICAQDAIDKTVDLVQNVEEYFKENKTCPAGYKQIYVKCGNDLKPNCIVPERQGECSQCWEVHWGPCAGKTSGGMWFYNTFERANRVAYLTASSSSCPWFESSNYMIVLNDPKSCLNKPTGYEMVSWSSPLQLQPQFLSIENFPSLIVNDKKELSTNNELDGLLEELIVDNGLSDDEKITQQLELLQSQAKALLAKTEEENKQDLSAAQNVVSLRGLAGKIESGEYDPNKTGKDNTTNNTVSSQTNPNNKDSTNSGSGNGLGGASGNSNADNCQNNSGTGVFTIDSRNFNAVTCGISPTSNDCPHNRVELRSGSEYISIYNMPTASSGAFAIKDFLNSGNCDLYISYPYGGSFSGTLTKTGPKCFTLTCTMKDPKGMTSSLKASGTY